MIPKLTFVTYFYFLFFKIRYMVRFQIIFAQEGDLGWVLTLSSPSPIQYIMGEKKYVYVKIFRDNCKAGPNLSYICKLYSNFQFVLLTVSNISFCCSTRTNG